MKMKFNIAHLIISITLLFIAYTNNGFDSIFFILKNPGYFENFDSITYFIKILIISFLPLIAFILFFIQKKSGWILSCIVISIESIQLVHSFSLYRTNPCIPNSNKSLLPELNHFSCMSFSSLALQLFVLILLALLFIDPIKHLYKINPRAIFISSLITLLTFVLFL